MKILTNKEINSSYIPFKVDHTKKNYLNFKLVKCVGWTKETSGKKYPVYEGYCKHCGTEITIPVNSLSKGKRSVRSCGCSKLKLTSQERIDPSMANPMVSRLYHKYTKAAELKSQKFALSKEEFYKLIISNCFYCNKRPYQFIKESGREFTYNGIDRVDNKSGYNKYNTVTCCGKCNFMKHSLKQRDFINQIKLIYENLLPGNYKFDKFGEKPETQVNPEPSLELTI